LLHHSAFLQFVICFVENSRSVLATHEFSPWLRFRCCITAIAGPLSWPRIPLLARNLAARTGRINASVHIVRCFVGPDSRPVLATHECSPWLRSRYCITAMPRISLLARNPSARTVCISTSVHVVTCVGSESRFTHKFSPRLRFRCCITACGTR
jgi:hypothetical protein